MRKIVSICTSQVVMVIQDVFSGTDILSESGVASGYQEYENGFDFAGTITTLIIEIGGRDINMAIGPLL